eukprot:3674609-Pyramimonas_sp.AAC.1
MLLLREAMEAYDLASMTKSRQYESNRTLRPRQFLFFVIIQVADFDKGGGFVDISEPRHLTGHMSPALANAVRKTSEHPAIENKN